MRNYLLVDLNNLLHRARHVHTGDISTTSSMALHIALNAMRQSWRRFKIDHVVVCLEGHSWRKNVYKAYKANRAEARSLMSVKEIRDLEYVQEVFDSFIGFLREKTNATILQSPNAEADDMIARWTQLHPHDMNYILSSDQDFYQLLSDNVKIYDGIKSLLITNNGVFNEKEQQATFDKIITETLDNGKKKKVTKTFEHETPDPEYELFFKTVRGDSSDNIMSAYPGVRENGSSKKPGIREAFNDRHNRGYDWNNFMLQEWDKLISVNEDGTREVQRVRVVDEYNTNLELIDLTRQPEEVKREMDENILSATSKAVPASRIGFDFIKFASNMNLVNIAKQPEDYANMFAKRYGK